MCEKRLQEYLKNIKSSAKQGDIQYKNLECRECFNEEFWDHTFVITGKNAENIAYQISDSFYGYYISKEDEGHRIGCTLPKEGSLFVGEYDRCPDAINLYSKVYEKQIKECIDENKQIFKFWYKENKNIEMSGDIDFNFKMRKIISFIDIVDNGRSQMGEENKQIIKNRLYSYHNLIYMPDNISLCPKTGALNSIKNSLGNDRLDTFIFALKLYYEEEIESFILSAGGMKPPFIANRNELKEYLDSFRNNEDKKQSIYNYCSKMYHIHDTSLVDDLCSSGKKSIDTPERVKEYLDLAMLVWKKKSDFYANSNDKVKSQYQKMLKEVMESRGLKYINSFTGTKDWNCDCQ